MKRTPLKRGTKQMKRSRVNPVNHKRKLASYIRNFRGPWADYDHRQLVSSLPCCACRKAGPSDPHHNRPRGMGGAGGNWGDMVPLCSDCHNRVENHGKEQLELAHPGLDLDMVAFGLTKYAYGIHHPKGETS